MGTSFRNHQDHGRPLAHWSITCIDHQRREVFYTSYLMAAHAFECPWTSPHLRRREARGQWSGRSRGAARCFHPTHHHATGSIGSSAMRSLVHSLPFVAWKGHTLRLLSGSRAHQGQDIFSDLRTRSCSCSLALRESLNSSVSSLMRCQRRPAVSSYDALSGSPSAPSWLTRVSPLQGGLLKAQVTVAENPCARSW